MSKKIQKLKEINNTIKQVLDELEFQLFINCINSDNKIKNNKQIVINKQK